jgi:hypothetical protein
MNASQFDTVDFLLEGSYCFDFVSFSEIINGASVAIQAPFCGRKGPSRLKSVTNNVVSPTKDQSILA